MNLLRPDIDVDRFVGEKVAVALGQAHRPKQRRFAEMQAGSRRVWHSLVTPGVEWLPQYWASLKFGVSREKAPALAQLFGRRQPAIALALSRGCPPRRTTKQRRQRVVCCKIVTLETNRNFAVRPATNMSSVIQSCEGAVDFSLREPRSCSRSPKSLQKANKNRHNLTVCRRPRFATAMQRPTPVCA